MKTARIHKIITALIMIVTAAVAAPQLASALGTASGTTINNAASVVYTVGTVTQPLYTGPTTTFAVDTVVIFNLSQIDVSPVQVAPGDNTSSTTRRLQFRLRNDSNADVRFQIAAGNLVSSTTITYGAAGYTDNRDTFSTITACFDANANNTCDGGENFGIVSRDTTTATIIVTGDIPGIALNGDIVGSLVTATAVDGAGATLVETAAPTLSGVDIVLADVAGTNDAARDASYTVRGAWQVSAALLTVTKAATIYSDPTNSLSNPKAIPGAVITYTITVTNAAGGAAATNVTISDSLNAEITAVPPHLAFATQFADGVNNCAAGQGVVVNNVCRTNTGADGDGVDFNATAANTITVSGLTINSPGTATVKFQVVIQ